MQHTVGQGCCAQVQPCCVLSKRKHAGQRRSIPVQCSSSFNENGATNNRGGPAGAFTTGSEAAARQQLFNRIAPIYDQVWSASCVCHPAQFEMYQLHTTHLHSMQFNDVLSLGQHRVWKKMAVKWSGAKRGSKALDVCCGSGDLAMLLAQTVGPTGEVVGCQGAAPCLPHTTHTSCTHAQVVGLDFAAEMLADASRRQQEREQLRGAAYNVQWVQGDALKLPFDANTFDAATIGYGLRNVANIPQALGYVELVCVHAVAHLHAVL